MFKEKLPAIGRALSLLLLIMTITVIVMAFLRARMRPQIPDLSPRTPLLTKTVTSVVEGYESVKTEKGREVWRLTAKKDTAYEDGRHELEKVDLIAHGEKNGKSMRVVADRGSYLRDQSIVTFEGNVKVTTSDGLEVMTNLLKYDQLNEIASTEQPIRFRRGETSGSSTGAQLHAKTRHLTLLKDARVRSENSDPKQKGGGPVEIQSEKANYSELEAVVRFEGNANVVQGEKSARADLISGFINQNTKKIDHIEMRGNSLLKSLEKGKASEMTSRDMDFFFDDVQQLKSAVATGAARAYSLEPDSPREINAERIEATYKPGEKESILQTYTTQGRTVMKVQVTEGAAKAAEVSERVVEGDSIKANFREDSVYLGWAEANGNAVLTITPKQITAKSEKKRLTAGKFTAEFYETGNAVKTFIADGNAVAEFEPLMEANKDPKKKDDKSQERTKRTLSGKKITGNFYRETQDIAEMVAEGNAKYTEGEKNATSVRATYTDVDRTIAMRGKPLLWDSTARTNADEIDSNVDTGESFMRGRVRTTYYSRESTDGAAPFKDGRGPVTVTSERAVVKHREGAARYMGNVRSWQDDDFVRADNMELDKGEHSMNAWGNAQSSFYNVEREIEKGRKETIPVFAQADQIIYNDETRTAHYEGSVKVSQGTDRINSLVADALMDEEKKLVQLTASQEVVMTQPNRRATGDLLVYTVKDDTAVLSGKPAIAEDREQDAVTKSSKLTLHTRDARIEANEESGGKKRVRTTHRIQK